MTPEQLEQHEQRVRDRTNYLRGLAEDFISKGIVPEDSAVFRRRHVEVVARGYFILSECYKQWRIESDHLTEPAKIAALTACAIVLLRPFRPLRADNATSFGQAFCNELFAIHAATAILSVDLNASSVGWKDFWDRIIDILDAFPGQTLEPLRIDHNLAIVRPDYIHFRTVHEQDKPTINALISICELLGGKLKL